MTGFDPGEYVDPNGAPKPGAQLGMLLSAYAALDPERPALTCNEVTLSRAALETAANRRARQLAAMGVAAGDVVVVALPNGVEYYETVLAAWKLGATPAQVSHRLTEAEFTDILSLAAPKLVIGGPAAAVEGMQHLAEGERPSGRLSAAALPPAVLGAWRMSTTGGSTGRPKLVVDPQRPTGDGNGGARPAPGATIINPGPLYHAAPFALMIPGLCEGCHVVEMGRFDAERWLALVEQYGVEWAYLVPTMMARIAKLPVEVRARYDIASLKTLLHTAAPCPDWVKTFWIDCLGPDGVWELYGGAERFGATLISGREWLERPGSVGRTRAGAIRVLGPDKQDLPTGDIGEIYFRWQPDAASACRYIGAEARRHGDWATYGDVGRLDADGYLYLADRRTDVILCGGANLYPAEIEAAIDASAGVLGSVVVGLPDADLGQRAHAVVQVASSAANAITAQDILSDLADRLTITKHPRSIEFTTRPIRDDAGKVRRSAWREECVQRMDSIALIA